MNTFLYRIKQFYRATTKRLDDEQLEWIFSYLPVNARRLFLAMHPIDQYHAYCVTISALEMVNEHKKHGHSLKLDDIDKDFLVRCTLLHDVGREKQKIHILVKVFPVLLSKLSKPNLERLYNLLGDSWLSKYIKNMFYIYEYHPLIGAKKLIEIGLAKEADIVIQHHKKITPNDDWVLFFLKLADAKN